MDIPRDQIVDVLVGKVDECNVMSPKDIARVLSLYIRIFNDRSAVMNVSVSYIAGYTGNSLFRKYGKHFSCMYDMFLRNSISGEEMKSVLKCIAKRVCVIPKNVSDMVALNRMAIEETHSYLKKKKCVEKRRVVVGKFKSAILRYLKLTYDLGFNEPSACVESLIERHLIDKYVLSGDFQVILLPFLPKVEDLMVKKYRSYEMTDSWKLLSARYFDHRDRFQRMALEIKAGFTKNISNFSDYFDRIYIDTYYRLMLKKGETRN